MSAWKPSTKSSLSGRFLSERCESPKAGGRRERGERRRKLTTRCPSFSLAGREDGKRVVFKNERTRCVKTFAASNDPSPSPLPSGEPDETSQGPGLIKALLNAPALAERYFQLKWWRKPLWYTITFGFSYFAANTISLSFGAKAVNDVVASVLVVVFYEAASRVVYKAKKRTVWHWLLHYFKLGAVVGFLMDSYKLGG